MVPPQLGKQCSGCCEVWSYTTHYQQ